MQTNAPATAEWVDQFNRAVTFGQVSVSTAGAVRFLNASADINYASISGSGGFLDSDVTVTGAELNDFCSVNCVSIRNAGDGSRALLFNAFVSAANTVTVRAVNPTASPINPGSYTFKILVAKGV